MSSQATHVECMTCGHRVLWGDDVSLIRHQLDTGHLRWKDIVVEGHEESDNIFAQTERLLRL